MTSTVAIPTGRGIFHATFSALGLLQLHWPGSSVEATQQACAPAKLLAHELREYLAGKDITFSAATDLAGQTPFRQKVLLALRSISRGSTISYGGLAQRAGSPRAARAVGNTISRNPLPIIIPCHRVLRANGDIGGWSGPAGWKEYLLRLEGCATGTGSSSTSAA